MFKIIAMLASGNAIAQIILLLCQPFLSRIYETSQFGVLAQIVSICSVVVIVGTLQMNLAMVLPNDDKESSEIFASGFLTLTFVFLVCLLIFSFCRTSIFGLNSSAWLPLICATFILAIGYGNLLRGWLTARGNFKTLSIFALVRSLLLVFFQFVLAYLNVENGLIFGALLGEILCLAIFVAIKSSPPFSTLVSTFKTPKRAWRVIHSYREFSCEGTIQEIVSVAVFTLPLYMFARTYSLDVGGQYAMANRLAWAPVVLIGGALSQVIFRHYAQMDVNELRESISFKLNKQSLMVILIGFISFWFAPNLFQIVLGEKWVMAGEMASWVAVWGVAFLLAIPCRVCYRVLRLQRLQLKVDSVVLIIVLFLFLKFYFCEPVKTMAVMALVGVFQNSMLVFLINRYISSNVEI